MLLSHRLFRSVVRSLLIGLLTFTFVLSCSAIAQAQLPSLPTGSDQGPNLPTEVSRHGEYETAPVRSLLDNKRLFIVITNVSNLTRLWSRVDFSILVAYENDPKRVLDVLQQVLQQMYDEPEWHDRIPEPSAVLGIDELSHMGMLVRVWIKTVPMEQWSVGREFRLRVRQAFATHGIAIGRPQEIMFNTDWIGPQVELDASQKTTRQEI